MFLLLSPVIYSFSAICLLLGSLLYYFYFFGVFTTDVNFKHRHLEAKVGKELRCSQVFQKRILKTVEVIHVSGLKNGIHGKSKDDSLIKEMFLFLEQVD